MIVVGYHVGQVELYQVCLGNGCLTDLIY